MLDKISGYFCPPAALTAKQNTAAALPCINCCNTPGGLSQQDYCKADRQQRRGRKNALLTRRQRIRCRETDSEKQQLEVRNTFAALHSMPRLPAGHGLLPPERLFSGLTHWRAEFIRTVAQLLTPAIARIAVDMATDRHSGGSLAAVDGAVTRIFNQLLPWTPTTASTLPLSTPPATVAPAMAAPDQPDYRIHRPGDNETLFRQQIDEFLLRAIGEKDDGQIMAAWGDLDIIFIYPEINQHSRAERAHEDVMRRWNMLQEMKLRDNTLSEEGIGAKIIAWADEHSERSFTLFKKGVDSYNPLCFLASGGEILVAQFARTIGEIYGGTLLERLPGESHVQRAQRLSLNLLMTPDPVASRAFGFRPARTGSRQKPVAQLPGTLITHPATGATLHSVLQGEIAGQRWDLFPSAASEGVAIRPGAHLPDRRLATRISNNLWRLEGIGGEHYFRHGKSLQWFIHSEEFFWPVKFSAQDGTAELSGGQLIYFHEVSKQWKLWYHGNHHLHNLALAILPEGVSYAALGPQRVMASIGHTQCEVWSTGAGLQYLKVRGAVAGRPAAENLYVAGRLEGDFFSISDVDSQPAWRQKVLEWHPDRRQWLRAESPFAALRRAERYIDLSWLQQVLEPQKSLVAVHQHPGLYRMGEEYFLRWQSDANGVDWYLPLDFTADAQVWRTSQPGAESVNTFYYNPAAARWEFRPLTSEAFFGLPQQVKVQFEQPLKSNLHLPEYQRLYFRFGDFWLHIGDDSMGRPEYIRVEQDSEDLDLFSLRVPGDNQPDTLWRFRYDDNNEYQLEDQRQCLPRVRRGDDGSPCAGPSGLARPAPEDAEPAPVKRTRLEQLKEAEMQIWLESHPRSPSEQLLQYDNSATRVRKNLAYALRLNIWSPEEMMLSKIAHHAGVAARRLGNLLSKISPEASYSLVGHPPRAGETDLQYALRLNRQFEEFTPRLIANFTGLKESDIIAALHPNTTGLNAWFRSHPRYLDESILQYAQRLARLPEGGSRITTIAAYTKVPALTLRLSIEGGLEEARSWLNGNQRVVGESDMDFAVRLYQQPQEKVTLAMIAEYAGVDKTLLLQRLGESWRSKLQLIQESQWFNCYSRNYQESNFDYALRLTKLRDQQVNSGTLDGKTISKNMIAMHANISPSKFCSQLHDIKVSRQWCNNHPRQPEELLTIEDDEAAKKEKNRRYALRLIKARAEQPEKRIKNRVIASHVGIAESQLKEWTYIAKQQWFKSIPRLPEEISAENISELAIQHNNQLYARRLASRRTSESMLWLIGEQDLCTQAEVTLAAYRAAQDPLFSRSFARYATPADSELIWEPGQGLLHLQLKQNPPLLTDAKNPQRSVTREVITGPVTISNLEAVLKGVPKADRQEVAGRFLRQAQELVDSDGSRQDYFYDAQGNKQPGLLSHKLQIYHDEQTPQLGMQIIAKEDFDAYELIGAYTGSWHSDEASFHQECRKMGSQSVLTYLWGVAEGEGSVSAYQNANKLALINTAKLSGENPPAAEPQNNVAAFYINGRLPVYYTIKKIAKGEQLLISYGHYYSTTYLLQTAINRDIVCIIARRKGCYFVINRLGEQSSLIYGPEGVVDNLPANTPSYLLQERLDDRGILRYDALWGKSGRKIALSKDNENNLYHAMAKAMQPRAGLDIINESIIQMKESVLNEHAGDEEGIKIEPDENAADY